MTEPVVLELEYQGHRTQVLLSPNTVFYKEVLSSLPNVTPVVVNAAEVQSGHSKFMQRLQEASDEVSKWPAWKQNLLSSSGQSTNSEPRPAV